MCTPIWLMNSSPAENRKDKSACNGNHAMMNKSEQFGHSFTQKDMKMQNKGEYYIQNYIQIYPKMRQVCSLLCCNSHLSAISIQVNYSGERKQPTLEGEYFRPPLAPGASTPDQENLRGRPADVGREKASSMKI